MDFPPPEPIDDDDSTQSPPHLRGDHGSSIHGGTTYRGKRKRKAQIQLLRISLKKSRSSACEIFIVKKKSAICQHCPYSTTYKGSKTGTSTINNHLGKCSDSF